MNAAAVSLPSDSVLPMSVSNATNLAVYAMVVSNSFLGLWKEEEEVWSHLSFRDMEKSRSFAMKDCLNLTTSNGTFMSGVHEMIVGYFDKADNVTVSDDLAKMEFSHVDLSETIEFDALTIEIPTEKFGKQQDDSAASNPFYKSMKSYGCNPEACLLTDEVEYIEEGDKIPIVYPRVQALAICIDDAGTEDMVVDLDYSEPHAVLQSCDQRSDTSMIIVSVGKRVEGDAFAEIPSDTYEYGATGTQLVNARVVYSLTVGRLSWTTTPLADKYGAECANKDGCDGVHFQLEDGSDPSVKEHLLHLFNFKMANC